MADLVIKRGYDLKLVGEPLPELADAPAPKIVGVRPSEFKGIKASVLVEPGQPVKVGTPLFCSKANPEIVIVSPAAGKVAEIRRGERRKLLAIVVEVGGQGTDDRENHGPVDPRAASPQHIRELLLKTGVWPLIQQHPFNHMAHPADTPKAIFISAAQTEPYAPDPNLLLADRQTEFQAGIDGLAKLASGKVHLTVKKGAPQGPALQNAQNVEKHTVTGPHPSGDPALHAFYIDRVKPGQVVWTLRADQVVTIGQALLTGSFPTDRIVTLAGNGVMPEHRRYYRTRAGAPVDSLASGRIEGAPDRNRFISGGVLSGANIGPYGFVGLLDNMALVIPEGDQRRDFIGWLWPGVTRYSRTRSFLSAMRPADTKYEKDTNLNGGLRACFQSGYCIDVCPTDTNPLFVWKSVVAGDTEEAEKLGITECVGCGLCTYVCPAKIEIDTIIQQGLELVEKGD